jgi:hypothetical protein
VRSTVYFDWQNVFNIAGMPRSSRIPIVRSVWNSQFPLYVGRVTQNGAIFSEFLQRVFLRMLWEAVSR